MAEDKVEIPIEIDPASLAALQKQFTGVSEKGINEAFKRLGAQQQAAGVNKVFQSLYAKTDEGKAEAAAKSREKLHAGVKSGLGVATAAAQGSPTGVLSSLGPYGAIAAGAINAVQALGDTIKSFVQAANPAVVEQLNMAFEDISGVIGHFLTPAVEAATPWVRAFGDFLASILPDSQELTEALAPLQEALNEFKLAIDPLIPFIKDALLDELQKFALAIKALSWFIENMPGMNMMKMAGSGDTDNWKGSQGMAYRGPASYQGIAEAGRGLHLAGFAQASANLAARAQEAQVEAAEQLRQINAKTRNQGPQPIAVGNN